MKQIYIYEGDGPAGDWSYQFHLEPGRIWPCTGCWSCWWKTPGRCIYRDLNDFYHNYVNADRAVFYAEPKRDFVSGTLKTLFDRMIPLFLPYIDYKTGESMHVPRYERYPAIEFRYKDNFDGDQERRIFESYIHRVFYQFHSESITVFPANPSHGKEAVQ